jgi:hypothetical protein
MKKLVVLLLLVAFGAAASEIIRRGAPISDETKRVALTDLLAAPEQYTKTPVVIEGLVETACPNKGCWMQVVPAAGEAGMRVTFKNYGFFVPKDSKGLTARMEGVAATKTLSKREADHLEEEGAKLTRRKDGTAVEVSFVASGVELRK